MTTGIVGGGISGLFLLHLLRARGVDSVLLEASELPGGVMQTRLHTRPRGAPLPLDLGPQRMRLSAGLAEVIDEVGLSDQVVEARPGIPFTMVRRGRLFPAPFSVGDALRTPLISWRGKVRALADLVTPGPRPEESVAEALTRKLGAEIYTRLAGPLLGGLYASDPTRMEARHTLIPAMRRAGQRQSFLRALKLASRLERVPVISFQEGMGALPIALARLHADRVHLGSPVVRVHHTRDRRDGEEGGFVGGSGFVIETAGGLRVAVRELVLALPAPGAAKILASVAPELSDALGSLRYNPLAVVPLLVPEGAPVPAVGSGFKASLDEHPHTRGVTSHDALFGRRGLFTAFLGGMGDEAVVERPDAELRRIATEDFRTVTGAEALPLHVHRTWMPAWDRSWNALDGVDPPQGVHLCAAYSDRPGIAGRLEQARRIAERIVSERASS